MLRVAVLWTPASLTLTHLILRYVEHRKKKTLSQPVDSHTYKSLARHCHAEVCTFLWWAAQSHSFHKLGLVRKKGVLVRANAGPWHS